MQKSERRIGEMRASKHPTLNSEPRTETQNEESRTRTWITAEYAEYADRSLTVLFVYYGQFTVIHRP